MLDVRILYNVTPCNQIEVYKVSVESTATIFRVKSKPGKHNTKKKAVKEALQFPYEHGGYLFAKRQYKILSRFRGVAINGVYIGEWIY
jgi:hypothetical protein